jgi:hypothetical protein
MVPYPDTPILRHPVTPRLRVSASPRLGIALLLQLSLVVLTASARVYWRSGGGPFGGGADPVWSRAYQADWRINNGEARVEAWSARLDLEEAAAQMRARLEARGGALHTVQGVGIAFGMAVIDDRVCRYLVASIDAPNAIVYTIEQTVDDFRASQQPPDRHQLRVVTPYPGSRPESYLASLTGALAAETSSSSASAAEIRGHFASTLGAQGWGNPFPERAGSDGRPFDLYLRGNDLVMVQALSSGPEGGSRIIVTHKRVGASRREPGLGGSP